ncbi:MAG: hypothetical protein WAX07_10170 [Candidatus Altiarchaeia archaeon]
MAELIVKLSKTVEERIKEFPEVNWPVFLEKTVERKLEHLGRMEELSRKFVKEEESTDWAVKLQRSSRKGRFEELKKKGLI